MVQQLVYLGVRDFVLIDHDVASESNLNRLIGANGDDVRAKRFKVDIAERLIRFVSPAAKVETVAEPFMSERGYAGLVRANIVVGCMDGDASRAILNEFCQAYKLPYMDVATDTGGESEVWFGGRILYSVNGELCVQCKDVLDEQAVRWALSTEEQKRDYERIYGVPRKALGATGPAVVSLNGVLASLAVTELMVEITGMRPAKRHLEYHGHRGIVTIDGSPPVNPNCWYCKEAYGMRDEADLHRYIREGWGKRLFEPEGPEPLA
jgi:molybdopterin/thiamine biosynthesis adenylyltransferase